MKIATILFPFIRSRHLEEVLKALKNNTKLPQKLFIFQDGMRDIGDVEEWDKVNNLINNVNWCDKEVIVSKENKGPEESIISGINYAFKEYDAVIVLEDDCVPAVSFIDFMEQCLEKYRDSKQIYSVSGYALPISINKGLYDVYGCGNVPTWGWATWKNKWDCFEKDYELIIKLRQKQATSRDLAIWGGNCEDLLVGNIRGTCNTWDVFWCLNVIAKNGICIFPYDSLIKNIGCDGSGAHCTEADFKDVKLMNDVVSYFNLPEEIDISDEVIEAFVPYLNCRGYLAINRDDGKKKRILVYGLGKYFRRNERIICEEYYVEAVIDRTKKGWFAGKKVIRKKEICQYQYDYILIMVWDAKERLKIVNELIMENIEPNKILIGQELYE